MEKEGNIILSTYVGQGRQTKTHHLKKKSLVNETQMLGGKPRMSDSKSMLSLPTTLLLEVVFKHMI